VKILLIHPPWMRFFGSTLIAPPVALNYLAVYIQKHLPEHEIEIYNADFAPDQVPTLSNYLFTEKHEQYVRRLTDPQDPIWAEIERVIAEYRPDVVGISSMTASYISAVMVSRIAKKVNSSIITIMGGKHPTALPAETAANESVDFVVIGEGEETLRELLENVQNPDAIRGIAFKDRAGAVRITEPRPYIRDINTLPLPIFESSLQKYSFQNTDNPAIYTWIMVSARGCPFQCLYCASDKIVRFRSPESVGDEVRQVKQKYGITRFCFEDDSFSLNKERLLKLCAVLKTENVTWICNTRVDLLDESIVSAMKQAGCVGVAIGIETGSEKTLIAISKKITLARVREAISLLRRHHLLVTGYFMVGFPWETHAEMKKTINLMRTIPLDLFYLSIVTPLPGTPLFQSLRDSGKIVLPNLDWKRFHQGSPFMNFSDTMGDAEWEKTIREMVGHAFRMHRKKYFFATLRKFCQEPGAVFRKIRDRLAKGPAMLRKLIFPN